MSESSVLSILQKKAESVAKASQENQDKKLSAWDLFKDATKSKPSPFSPELLKEAVYLLQGFKEKLESPSCISQANIFSEFRSIGQTYKRISNFCRSASVDKGNILRTCKEIISVHLNQFTSFLALLEEKIMVESKLTILNVLVMAREKSKLLDFLSKIISKIEQKFGSQILVELVSLSRTGDPVNCEIASTILAEAFKPWAKDLYRWLLKGELSDNNVDSFIKLNQTSTADIWNAKFSIDSSRLPSILSKETAHIVLCSFIIDRFSILENQSICFEPLIPITLSIFHGM